MILRIAKKSFARTIFLTLPIILCSNLFAQDADGDQKIPELPPAESSMGSTKLKRPAYAKGEELSSDNSENSWGFFSDTGMNRGYGRYLNTLELSGYLRLRMQYFRNAHLKTFVPQLGYGTSAFSPSLNRYGLQGDDLLENPTQNNFSGNMRLRVEPTLNISESVRIKSTLDVFDNMVLGSTPAYMGGARANPSSTLSLNSMTQAPPNVGVNSMKGALQIKRVWGEANFPIGEIRFGRMPYHWGLGIVHNSGDDINSDFGDQIDGVSFSTKLFDHYLNALYSIAYVGPTGRGGGNFNLLSSSAGRFSLSEDGQRFPLDGSDLTHVFSLSFLKRESDYIIAKKREEGILVFNYGLLGSYRFQTYDSQHTGSDISNLNNKELKERIVKRNGNIGVASLWSEITYKDFHIEAEFAGAFGKYDLDLANVDNAARGFSQKEIWILKGGAALNSKYGFMDDRLQIGIDTGVASSEEGPGFGIRSAEDAETGKSDGRKTPSSKYLTAFRFNPAYTVDNLMFKEVFGTVSGAYYFKPHISYFFSRNFGVRSDVITSLAIDKENTSGFSNWLGVEIDGSAFLRSDNGFYFALDYGLLIPLSGLNHRQEGGPLTAAQYRAFGTAKIAQSLQFYLGLLF